MLADYVKTTYICSTQQLNDNSLPLIPTPPLIMAVNIGAAECRPLPSDPPCPDHQRHHVMDTKNVQSEIIEQWTNQILKEENKNAAKKTYVLGSRAPVHFDDNIGFFATIMAAYNNHWALKTSPDDWWMTIRKFEMFK